MSNVDPLFDFASESFDPLKALYEHHPKDLPAALDNLGKCRVLLPKDDPNRLDAKVIEVKPQAKPTPKVEEKLETKEVPEKSTTSSESTPSPLLRTTGTVLDQISDHLKDTMRTLYKAYHSQQPITVYIRRIDSIRSKVTGTLVGFDKHWNLILKDVQEVIVEKNPKLRDRKVKHLFIKGDSVVLVNLPEG